jgi:enterochelin esterase family protein
MSSGGICSFNVAWQKPEDFSRVISWIGSFTSIQWHEDPAVADGGQDYPDKILREDHRNLRVWLQDGTNDQENPKLRLLADGEYSYGECAEVERL